MAVKDLGFRDLQYLVAIAQNGSFNTAFAASAKLLLCFLKGGGEGRVGPGFFLPRILLRMVLAPGFVLTRSTPGRGIPGLVIEALIASAPSVARLLASFTVRTQCETGAARPITSELSGASNCL